jgi:hypothetical protein
MDGITLTFQLTPGWIAAGLAVDAVLLALAWSAVRRLRRGAAPAGS